jgi:hypothetical protein
MNFIRVTPDLAAQMRQDAINNLHASQTLRKLVLARRAGNAELVAALSPRAVSAYDQQMAAMQNTNACGWWDGYGASAYNRLWAGNADQGNVLSYAAGKQKSRRFDGASITNFWDIT